MGKWVEPERGATIVVIDGACDEGSATVYERCEKNGLWKFPDPYDEVRGCFSWACICDQAGDGGEICMLGPALKCVPKMEVDCG